ncbi:hypothetical protein V6N11_026687 [Hibiscus sabdariffa]|uniref:Uncharacterized protein n=1 Tax=Hibiscus sabdariffa TaxID=183260 RepID=A0ABR2SXA5_9ROSI
MAPLCQKPARIDPQIKTPPVPPLHYALLLPSTFLVSSTTVLVDPLLKPSPFQHHRLWYNSMVSSSSGVTHVYDSPIHGFSATFTPDQAKSILELTGILSLYPDRVMHLHTTRSPSFLGLQATNPFVLNTSGSDSIIGFVDTGAGTIDRDFPAKIHLKNNVSVLGTSITLMPDDELVRKHHPLHFVGQFNSSSKFKFSRQLVKGKIVFCMTQGHVNRLSLGAVLKRNGAVAMIISHGIVDPNGIVSEPHVIPTISVGIEAARQIEDYIISSYKQIPKAKISSQGTIPMHARPAPIVASFSSRAIAVEAERVWHRDRPVVITRKLKTVNVGSAEYEAKIVGPKGYYKVEVRSKRVKFSGMSEVVSFRVFIEKDNGVLQERKKLNLWFGAVVWREIGGKHEVKCPIVIFSKEYTGGWRN